MSFFFCSGRRRRLPLRPLRGGATFDSPHVLHAILEGFCVEIIQSSALSAGLKVSETLVLSSKQLGLILDPEVGLFHLHKIFSTEFAVVAYPSDLKALVPQVLIPLDHVAVVGHFVIGHIQPAIILPAKQGDLVLVSLDHCSRQREPAMWDDNVYPCLLYTSDAADD